MPKKIGILGGTFNPIHFGHLAAAEEARERIGLDRVMFVPAFHPPHKHGEGIPSALQRLEMVRIAIRGNPHFEASDIEIVRGGRSFSVDTVESLHRMLPETDLYFIMGIDSFLEIQTWNRWERFLSLCSVVILSRPGYRFADLLRIDFMRAAQPEFASLDQGGAARAAVSVSGYRILFEKIPLHDISSTDIRDRIKHGAGLKYLLPEPVEIYIIENNLYA